MKKVELPANYDKQTHYSLTEATELLPKLSKSKFVGSVDIDIVLNLTEKQMKDSAAGSVVFPNQFGGDKKVVVLADTADAKTAKDAGADEAGLDDLVKKIEDGNVEFDVVIATPAVMAKIAKLGRVLGPKGLMPNPNNGTVASDVAAAVASFKAGKINFKKNDQGTIRGRVAKLDMTPEQIAENVMTYLKAVYAASRKFGIQPIKKVTLSPTMGPAVRLDMSKLNEEIAK